MLTATRKTLLTYDGLISATRNQPVADEDAVYLEDAVEDRYI